MKMKKTYLITVLSAAICFGCATNVLAQAPKIISTARKVAASPRPSVPKVSPLTQPLPVAAIPTPRISPNYKTKFLTRYQRPLIGLQRAVGINTRQAIQNVRNWGAQPPLVLPRPTLMQDRSFTTADLTQFKVPRNLFDTPAPKIPFQHQRALIYRGLGLNADGAAIRNILQNGLRVQDAGSEANTLRLAMAGPHARSVITQLSQPITNLTSNPADATFYATRLLKADQISVVAVVRSVEKGSIIVETQDIPADQIYALAALLYIDGERVWCKIELDGENFRITPYEPYVE